MTLVKTLRLGLVVASLLAGGLALAPSAHASQCDLALTTCVVAIADATVSCWRDFGIKHCTGVGTPGVKAWSLYGLSGSGGFSGTACGGPRSGDCGNYKSALGTCSWGLANTAGCEKKESLTVGTDTGLSSASYYVKAQSSASASTSLGRVTESKTATFYKSL